LFVEIGLCYLVVNFVVVGPSCRRVVVVNTVVVTPLRSFAPLRLLLCGGFAAAPLFRGIAEHFEKCRLIGGVADFRLGSTQLIM
jgi:hypothetical protein